MTRQLPEGVMLSGANCDPNCADTRVATEEVGRANSWKTHWWGLKLPLWAKSSCKLTGVTIDRQAGRD